MKLMLPTRPICGREEHRAWFRIFALCQGDFAMLKAGMGIAWKLVEAENKWNSLTLLQGRFQSSSLAHPKIAARHPRHTHRLPKTKSLLQERSEMSIKCL
jgi:hypothetical protein